MADLIKFRRRRSGSSANPVPQAGEPIYDFGSKKLYVGDGTTSLNALRPIGEQTTIENATNAVNVTTSINGKTIPSIFESNGTTVKNATNATNAVSAADATNVTTSINGKAITNIFESNGTTAKNATVASKIGSTTIGSASIPVYINNGTPAVCTMSSLSVGSATKATQDGNGSNIRSTYASTIDATYEDSTLTLKLKNPNGTQISSKEVTISISGTAENADKLDGQHGDYYLTWSNMSGKIPYNKLPSLYVGDKAVSSSSSSSFKVVTYTGSSAIGSTTKPVYLNASGAITASNASVGSATQPVYMSNGVITACSNYAGGTNLTVNGASKGGTSASIYAPTNAISTTDSKRYLLGSSSTANIASTNTNDVVYMQNGRLYANNIDGEILDTRISNETGTGLNASFRITAENELTTVNRYVVTKSGDLNTTVGDNNTPVFVTKTGQASPCYSIKYIRDSGTLSGATEPRFQFKTIVSGTQKILQLQFVNANGAITSKYNISLFGPVD